MAWLQGAGFCEVPYLQRSTGDWLA